MKRFILVAILIGALAALLAGTALAQQGPVATAGQGDGACGCTGTSGAGMTRGPAMRSDGNTGVGRGAPAWAGDSEEVAALLKLTEEQLQAERQAGKSLVQIAEKQGVLEETLINTILAAKKADLDELVAAEKLTQVQADAMIERMQSQVEVMVNRTNVGPAFAQGQDRPGMGAGMAGGTGGGMAGGMRGGMRGARGANR